jgi:hypothetical protein
MLNPSMLGSSQFGGTEPIAESQSVIPANRGRGQAVGRGGARLVQSIQSSEGNVAYA